MLAFYTSLYDKNYSISSTTRKMSYIDLMKHSASHKGDNTKIVLFHLLF